MYTRSCAPCHGTSGEGGPGNDLIPAAPDLTDTMWDHGSTDGELFSSIKDGIAPEFNMTPFKDRLKDDEIWQKKLQTFQVTDRAAKKRGVTIPDELRPKPPSTDLTLTFAGDPSAVDVGKLSVEFSTALKQLSRSN